MCLCYLSSALVVRAKKAVDVMIVFLNLIVDEGDDEDSEEK